MRTGRLISKRTEITYSMPMNIGLTLLQVKLEEEDTSTLCDRLLPLVIGLLRTVSGRS